MCDSALFDQAVASLRGLTEEIRGAAGNPAGIVPAPIVQAWTDKVDSAIADLLEGQRRARYGEALAIGIALAEAIAEGPPDGERRSFRLERAKASRAN